MLKSAMGVTLSELLIVIALMGIFAAISVPSYRSIIQNNRAASLTNDFTSLLSYARSEAIKRGISVSVCASATTNQSACGGNNQWQNGWIVFIDANADGVLANANDRLKVFHALPTGATLSSTKSYISYNSDGFVNSGVSIFTLSASGCTGQHGRMVNVSNTGRLSISAASCGS